MTNDDDFTDTRQCICSALRRASRVATQHYEASFRGTGLRATQFTLLAALIQTGPVPLGTLANMLGLERTTLTRNVALLEEKGYVQDLIDDDSRVRRLAITPEGRAAARAALGAWRKAQAGVSEVLRRAGVGQWLQEP